MQKGLLRRGQGLQRTDVPSPALSEGTGEGGGREEIEQMLSMADKEAGFALEMQIQIKRAEREKKRQVRSTTTAACHVHGARATLQSITV